jgi:HD-like signal output (HDOD) protein
MLRTVPIRRSEEQPSLDLRFPPLPQTVVDVTNLLADNRDVPDTPRLVEIVNRDPVVAASVLRRINSAYYGMRRLVGDIRKAVFLLGFLEVSNVVLTTALTKLKEVLSSREQAHIFEQIMRVSVISAYYTQEIARFAGLDKTPTAFTVGLLHSMGRLVLLYNRSVEYEALWRKLDGQFAPTADEEREMFDMDHLRLGCMAADHWNLPADVATIIGSYQTPELISDPEMRRLACALALGVASAERVCLGNPAVSEEDPPEMLLTFASAVQLTPELITELLQSIGSNTPSFLDHLLQD